MAGGFELFHALHSAYQAFHSFAYPEAQITAEILKV
jgi:hypothetical protein